MKKLAFILAIVGLISLNGYSQKMDMQGTPTPEMQKKCMMKTMKQNPKMEDQMMGMMMENENMRNKMHMMMMNDKGMSSKMMKGDGMKDMGSKEGMMKMMKENPKMQKEMMKK
jgi:hypothetical protein